jgi:hypothetical protein
MNKKVVLVFTLIFLVFVGAYGVYLLSASASESRAKVSMEAYLLETGVKPTRKSCAYDSDTDGYASCTIATESEVIQLQCTSGIVNTLPVIGSKSCKEQYNQVLKLNKGK